MSRDPEGAAVPSRRRRLHALVAAAGRDVVGLVVPVACAGCGRVDERWCGRCATTLDGPVLGRDHGAGRLDLLDGRTLLPVLGPGTYTGPLRHGVAAWKDGGRTDLDRPFAAAARRTGVALAPRLRPVTGGVGPVLVVAVPSTAQARRRRGRDPVDVLAAAVAAGLRSGGVPAVRARPLRRAGGPDLAGLGARARGDALRGRVRVGAVARLRGRVVVLVDDVLTTGATLAACHGALVAAGARPAAAGVLAATPQPGGVGVADVAPPGRGVSRRGAEEG
ncbi:ComF family protein [Cellulomonas sp. zg-ZUI22]|uniref:ComF family protein n=1 Tax=Cellulomonas sp. zg-ZUI22 TaxID=2816955 RepID=UPI001A94CB90|nr:ComF family protein [Cellulomonas sp. zg-ZUI22]MBO0899893.1 ComF family protein [Cellulomonas sp. zg-ZUI22]